MIRYKLLSREEALEQLESYYERKDKSIYNILNLLKEIDMEYLNNDVIRFYNNSKFYRKKY